MFLELINNPQLGTIAPLLLYGYFSMAIGIFVGIYIARKRMPNEFKKSK